MAASIPAADVNLIIFACEAGIGSSAMGVNSLKKKLKAANLTSVQVVHKPARSVPTDAKVVVTHRGLADMVRQRHPNAVVISFSQFLNDPVFDALVQKLKAGEAVTEVK